MKLRRSEDVILLPIAMLIIVLAPLPYWYYTVLVLIVTAGAATVAFIECRCLPRLSAWSVAFGLRYSLIHSFQCIFRATYGLR